MKHNSGIIGQFYGNNARVVLVKWESSTASPSSSIESSDSGPNTSSNSGPSAVDSSGSEPEDSQEPGQEVDVRVISLLSRLKSPSPSDSV